jgi:hypothetical protein
VLEHRQRRIERLDQIREIATEEGKADLAVAIDGLKAGGTGKDKIDAVRPLLPAWLAPEATNPLRTIYAALNDGLHNDSDEECTEAAEKLRVTLAFVAGSLHRHKADRQDFVAALRSAKTKNAKKVAAKGGRSEDS